MYGFYQIKLKIMYMYISYQWRIYRGYWEFPPQKASFLIALVLNFVAVVIFTFRISEKKSQSPKNEL